MRVHEPIEITLPGGETVRGDFHFTGSPGENAVVFTHGFASNRRGEKSQALEAACARIGWAYAAFDCRGHGESDGQMRDLRPSRLQEDLNAVCDWLKQRGIRRLFLVGSSMGASVSAWCALDREDVRACVFIAPAFRFLERRWETLSEFERSYWQAAGAVRYTNEWIDVEIGFGLMEERHLYPFTKLAERWTKPALIFHGLADETVPIADSTEFLRLAPGTQIELRLFKDGDHRMNAYKDEMAAEACRFFQARQK